jgi:predicted transcriptional regulator
VESIAKQLPDMEDESELFKSQKLFGCILGLNGIESNVFSYLLKHKNVSTADLESTFSKDRSSIQRALLKLLKELHIIERNSLSLKEYNVQKGILTDDPPRGYLYVYSAKELEMIKTHLHRLLDNWYKKMQQYIDSLDETLDCIQKEC